MLQGLGDGKLSVAVFFLISVSRFKKLIQQIEDFVNKNNF